MSHPQEDLTEEEVHGVLSNKRRRLTLGFLSENGGEMSARELSERIAEAETGESPPPRNIRQSAYVSLHQTHLPKLDELGIVAYDAHSKRVELREPAGEVTVYLETVPRYGLSWSEFYVGLSILGTITIFGSQVGVPLLSSVPAATWGYLSLLLIGASAVYQTYRQGSSIVHRLRE